VTESGSRAAARLGVFAGEWILEARFPGDQPAPEQDAPQVRSRFEWALDGTVISGAWEKRSTGGGWAHDFDLTYRKAR